MPNHAWNMYDFGNGLLLPADAVPFSRSMTRTTWLDIVKRHYPSFTTEILPRYPLVIELFLARHYLSASAGDGSGFTNEDKQAVVQRARWDGKTVRDRQDEIQKISFAEWLNTDTRYLNEVQKNWLSSRKQRK